MFVSFAIDNGIRFTAHFYDASSDKVETRVVTGWVTGDDGLSQATVLVPETGLQVRVGAFQHFLAVTSNGQADHETIVASRLADLKKALAASTPTPKVEA